jgi:hypothetical protein
LVHISHDNRYCAALYRFAKSRFFNDLGSSTFPGNAHYFLSEGYTLFFINHERVKSDRIAYHNRVPDILDKDIGDSFIAVEGTP